MPRSAAEEAETVQWIFAALNSIEMATVPWWFLGLSWERENAMSGWADSRREPPVRPSPDARRPTRRRERDRAVRQASAPVRRPGQIRSLHGLRRRVALAGVWYVAGLRRRLAAGTAGPPVLHAAGEEAS